MAITIQDQVGTPYSTAGLNNKTKAVHKKGIIRGDSEYPGTVIQVAGQLKVRVNKFKAINQDGLLVVSDTTVDMPVAENQTYYVVLHSRYVTDGPSFAEVKLLTTALYQASLFQAEYVIIARFDVAPAATQVETADIYYYASDLIERSDRQILRGTVSTVGSLPADGNLPGDMYVVLSGSAESKDDASYTGTAETRNMPTLWVWAPEATSLLPTGISTGYSDYTWMPCPKPANMTRVYNNSGSSISAMKLAVIYGTTAELGHAEDPLRGRILPIIKLLQPSTSLSLTFTAGRPVYVPAAIANNSMGWVVTEGPILYPHTLDPGQPVWADVGGEIYGADSSGQNAPHNAIPIGWAVGANHIWLDPGRIPAYSKKRWGNTQCLSLSDADLGAINSTLGYAHSGGTGYGKAIEFDSSVVTPGDSSAFWTIPLGDLVNVDYYNDGLNPIRVRFNAVYFGTDVADILLQVRVVIQKVGSAIKAPDDATATFFAQENVVVTTNGTANSVYNVSQELGDTLFDGFNFFNGDPATDILTISINRISTDVGDTAIDTVAILNPRVDFNLKPIALVP